MQLSRSNSFLLKNLFIFFTAVWPLSSFAGTAQCNDFYQFQAVRAEVYRLIKTMDKDGRTSAFSKNLVKDFRIAVIRARTNKSYKDHILINPQIDPMTNDRGLNPEGCARMKICTLVPRYKHIRVEYADENGKPHSMETHGDLAYKIQHVSDNLNENSISAQSVFMAKLQERRLLRTRETHENHIQIFARLLDQSISDSYNPYSLAFDVKKNIGKTQDFKKSTETLLSIVLAKSSSEQRSKLLNDWVISEAHALFVYDLMSNSGLNSFQSELNYLITNNVYFIESLKSGNSLVTYSFEKEGTTDDISLLFRPTEYSEKNWMAKSDEERIQLLKDAKIPSKTFIRASKIMPTDFKPDAVGGYSVEVSDHRKQGYGWEISHKKYEINHQRLMREIREVSTLFNQSHSFHLHVSFELPKNYVYYENFIHWFKHLNDYLYLKGLEEGLHGNYLTGVANFIGDMSISDRIRNFVSGLYTPNTIQESQNKLSRRNSKFFSAGLRGKIYGKASSDDTMRLGIELRDSTRNIDLLDKYSAHVGRSVSTLIWEKSDPRKIRTMGLRLTSDRKTAQKDISDVVSPRFAKMFAQAEATVAFGLHHYEDQPIYDYHTHSWNKVPPATAKRIRDARELYIKDLKDLEIELTGLEAKGEKTEVEIIQSAIRMSLATWAKKARASELFESF